MNTTEEIIERVGNAAGEMAGSLKIHNEDFAAQHIAAIDADLAELRARDERRDAELTEAYENASYAMGKLNVICDSAKELAELLRERFNAPPDLDAVTLYSAAMLSGFASGWLKNPPENGIVKTMDFVDIGKLEIQVRRVEGKTAEESLRAMQAERDELRARFATLEADFRWLYDALLVAPDGTLGLPIGWTDLSEALADARATESGEVPRG